MIMLLLMYVDTCDMQYGFKKKHSTTWCTVVLKEIVQHYREGNSDVYCCLLDSSKAFDKLHYGELFTLLLSTKMPVKILRLIIRVGKMPAFMSKVHAGGIYRHLLVFTGVY